MLDLYVYYNITNLEMENNNTTNNKSKDCFCILLYQVDGNSDFILGTPINRPRFEGCTQSYMLASLYETFACEVEATC